MMSTIEVPPPDKAIKPKGYLTFKAIRTEDGDRVSFIGAMPVFDLIDKQFIVTVESPGLSDEIFPNVSSAEPVQRKTIPAHVQGIVDYIVERAEGNKPWAFNSIFLYSTKPLEFNGVSI